MTLGKLILILIAVVGLLMSGAALSYVIVPPAIERIG